MLEDKISSSMYKNSKGEVVVRTIPSIALPSEWNDITIENNVLGNPTIVKYFLNSIFLLKVNITYDVDNETIIRVQTSTVE